VKLPIASGVELPKGSTIAVPSEQMNHDPAVYTNPDVFDGLRHYRLRQQNSEADLDHHHQFTSIDQTSMNWGYGRHACPGRHCASEMIKVVLALTLLECDVKYEEDKGRPENIYVDTFIIPDMSTLLQMRKRL